MADNDAPVQRCGLCGAVAGDCGCRLGGAWTPPAGSEAPVPTPTLAEVVADLDRPMLEKNLRTLTRLGETCGEWTDKIDARQAGYSLHVRFEKPTTPMITAEHAVVMQSAPAMLADAIRRLLSVLDTPEAQAVAP